MELLEVILVINIAAVLTVQLRLHLEPAVWCCTRNLSQISSNMCRDNI